MRVSALIPTYNRRNSIVRAVESVLSQTVPVEEIIVVDDGSTDRTAELLAERFGSKLRIVRQANQGVSAARKRAISEASGDWVAFLDSDDAWTKDRNREFLKAAQCVPSNVAWIFGNLRIVSDEGEGSTLFEEFGLKVEGSLEVFSDTFTVHFPFQFGMLQGSFIRRSVLVELHCFSEGLQHSEDLLAGFQVACRYKFAAIPSVVGKYYRTSDLTSNSAILKGFNGPDYFRSRMLCFALVIEEAGRKSPWNMRYASAARGLCKVLVKQGKPPGNLGLKQFKFGGVSAKGVAFLCATLFGRFGVQTWNSVADFRRKVFPEPGKLEKAGGLMAAIKSVRNADPRT